MASKSVKHGFKTYKLSYEMCGDGAQSVLFLHGWGANKELMKKAFSAHFGGFRHIYLDMPGFGESDIFEPLQTSDYAKIVQNFIAQLPQKPHIIVGHSFGGKVATLLEPDVLVLLSSAGILVKKRLWVRVKIAVFKFFKLLGLGRFYTLFATKDASGMSRVMYETLKNVVNEDFSAKFSRLGSKTFIFWGETDRATPLKSGEKIHELVKNSKFYPLHGDHFFFLLHAKFISEQVTTGICDMGYEPFGQPAACTSLESEIFIPKDADMDDFSGIESISERGDDGTIGTFDNQRQHTKDAIIESKDDKNKAQDGENLSLVNSFNNTREDETNELENSKISAQSEIPQAINELISQIDQRTQSSIKTQQSFVLGDQKESLYIEKGHKKFSSKKATDNDEILASDSFLDQNSKKISQKTNPPQELFGYDDSHDLNAKGQGGHQEQKPKHLLDENTENEQNLAIFSSEAKQKIHEISPRQMPKTQPKNTTKKGVQKSFDFDIGDTQ